MATADYSIFNNFKGVGGAQKEAGKAALEKQILQAKLAASAQGADLPSNVQEYQFYQALTPENQAKYLQMKRADKYLDTGNGFVRPNPITNEAIPVTAPGGNNINKTLTPDQQADADRLAREEQDKFNRGLDVKQKALAAAERLVGKPNAQGELEGGNISGVRANRGGLSRILPNISNDAVDAQADLETLTNLLTTDNLGLLKGVLSDTDMKVLASIGAGEIAGSDKKALAALRRMRQALAGTVQGMQEAKQNLPLGGLPPLSSEFIDAPVDNLLQPINPNKPSGAPKMGEEVGGYIFLGGNPADQKRWKKAR